MRYIRLFEFWSIFLVCFTIGCKDSKTGNVFTSDLDTLIIHTDKQRGLGFFSGGLGFLDFRDIQDTFPYQVKLPEDFSNVKRTMVGTYFKAENPVYLDIIQGKINQEQVFVVDQNNNKDLTDDSVRVFSKVVWKTEQDLIDVKYQLEQDGPMRSSWVKMGEKNGDLLYGRYEHLRAQFMIDQETYQVGIVDTWNLLSFTYSFASEIALLSDDSNTKDTLEIRDLIKKNEFIELGGIYYRFDSITYSGDQIYLVKENDFGNQVGTQVGMIAPEFEGISTDGDTVKSVYMVGKPIIIGNSCGCGGDEKSTQAYYDILQEYGDRVNVLRLDAYIADDIISDGIHIDMENSSNLSMYNDYRAAFCSRICYVIGTNNRIIDKFQITDWKPVLSRLFL